MELKQYEENITSQWGEDGVVTEIFKRIGTENSVCVEFGAWDGKHFSNCWHLWHEKSWSAILIEGDKERAAELAMQTTSFPQVTTINKYVAISGTDSIDALLDRVQLSNRIDLMSIDIDSDDYAIFKSLKRKPRVVIIEYNPTIPPHIDLVQEPGEYLGNSVSAIYKLAKEKKYRLAHLTYTNLILVHEDEWQKLEISEVDYFRAFEYDRLTCVINTYDGDTILSQPIPYNGGYLETENTSLKKAVKQSFLRKRKKTKPKFDSNGDLIYCTVKKVDLE